MTLVTQGSLKLYCAMMEEKGKEDVQVLLISTSPHNSIHTQLCLFSASVTKTKIKNPTLLCKIQILYHQDKFGRNLAVTGKSVELF